MTAQEAAAIRALLAARAAAGQQASARPAPGPRKPSGSRSTTTRRTPSGTRSSSARRPAARSAKRRPSRPSAWQRLVSGSDAQRWKRRALVVALGVVLPVLAGTLSPTPPAPATAAASDPTGVAVATRQGLADAAARYRQLQQDLAGRRDALARAEAAEAQARAATATAQAAVGELAADLYRRTPGQRMPLVGLDADDPGAAADVLWLQGIAEHTQEQNSVDVVRAARAQQAVTAAATATRAARLAVDSALAESRTLLAEVRRQVSGLAPATTAQLAALGAVPAAAEQQERNQQALRRWQDQLGALALAGIQPPTAAELADPAALPPGFSPALDGTGTPVPGVALAVVGNRPVTVLPAETVAAVSIAFAQLGRPYLAGGTGPDAYDCGGLTTAAWMQAGYGLPAAATDQWATGAPVPVSQLQVGDLVFADGGADVGIYVGEGQVLGSSAAGWSVGVRVMAGASGAIRVTLPAPAAANPALPAAVSGNGACGAPPSPVGPVSPAWGGFGNGRIPAAALCAIGEFHALRCDAAAGYAALADAFAEAFDRPLCITDSYRSFGAQVSAFRAKPRLAAVPGTSNHGWALAVDLCGGINRSGSAEWRWMSANAGRFGFVQPDWAGPAGEKPEPWHWEFGHLLDS
ncbi:NlpC/P60 family protein [Trujillonella endophytica]|uniref:D-alanyl-D-alanine carboxypeptidase n=1 Tax=Trujillonella endophytica TaxID=673521 RepID=A0A1H8SI74_9ACTN|nr:NlpC/P60 family protein [Trujillella endophytica]SEO77978.1 D-alanyl-D-alanine carboxypeptidase [Trujillella endophytica]